MVEPSRGCIAVLHECSNRRRSLHQGSTDGCGARVHTGLRGCVPRAFTTPLCTHLWHTHATCITVAVLAVVMQVWMRLCANAVVLHMEHR